MKIAFCIIVCLVMVHSFSIAEMLTWTSSSGQKISAEIVRYDKGEGKVTIKKRNGKSCALPLDTLSEADREWLGKWHQSQLDKIAREKAFLAKMNKGAG